MLASNTTGGIFNRSASALTVWLADEALGLVLSAGAARTAKAARRGRRTLELTKTMSEAERDHRDEPQKIQTPFHISSYTRQPQGSADENQA